MEVFQGVSVEDKDKSRKKKRSKQKKSGNEFAYRPSNDSYCGEEEPSTSKKKKKEIKNIEAEQYRPGMLSDFLQKQKYGSLILPWEASFCEDRSGQFRIEDDGIDKQRSKIKINPLFDKTKENEGNIVTKNCNTFTIFVGNLPQEVTKNRVKKIFKKLGNTISKIKLKSDFKKSSIDTKNQYKHAIVKFNTSESYKAALKMNGKLFGGHHLRITGSGDIPTSDSEKSVFIGNLAAGTSDDVLWKTFENCGEIDSVRVIRDKLNKKGVFGYINFQAAESVEEALKLDGITVLDREIRVRRINKNIDSLSNSITVKRNKRKQAKTQPNATSNAVNGVQCGEDDNMHVKKQKKSHKSSNHEPASNTIIQEIEAEISLKKKKKKKNIPEAIEKAEF